MTTTEVKNSIINAGIAVVTFNKKNGEKRVMKCTLNKSLLREMANNGESSYTDPTESASYDAESLGMVRVWDLENDGWRTITAESAVVEAC